MITPYYSRSGIDLYLGDCRLILPQLTEKVDLIVTSPPFNLGSNHHTGDIKHTPYPELEKQRAFRYGRPGRYRIQAWGLEYRTPSNSWTNKEEALEEMVEGAKFAFELLQNPKRGKELLKAKLDDTIQAIKTANSDLATQILQDSKVF